MYSKTKILTAASKLVGWSASTDSQYANISSDYTTSDSGYYVNDLPGITVSLLSYVSKEKTVANYIAAVHRSETLKTIDRFLAKQKKDLNTKELLSNITVLQNYNDLDRRISSAGRFVGYVITPRESKTIATLIQQVGFMSPAAQSFTLYLFVSSKKEALQTETITITSTDTLEWTTLNWNIHFDDELYGAGEHYIIGYFENDLTHALYESDWIGKHHHIAQKIFGHYMGISPIRFNAGVLNGVNLPDLKYLTSSLNCMTSGFNLRFNTKCDISKVLVDNITMFGEAVQHQIVIRILNDALSNIELNNVSAAQSNRERWKELISEYSGKLNGGLMEGIGYIPGLIDKLSIDFSYLDSVCLKKKAHEIMGVKW